MAAPTVSVLPDAPTRQNPVDFSAKADALLSALNPWTLQLNTLGSYMNTTALSVESNKLYVQAQMPSVLDAVAAAPQALSYRDTTKTYMDAAAQSEIKALQHKNDAASAVVYQNLASSTEQFLDDAIDMCIDTSPNPPLAVQMSTSWFAELGPMPTKKIAVLESARVVIRDGDDPSFPIWCEFKSSGAVGSVSRMLATGGDNTAIHMLNGILCVTDMLDGMYEINFAHDRARIYRVKGSAYTGAYFQGDIYQRNDTLPYLGDYDVAEIAGQVGYFVTMRAYPWSPVDPYSGLQVPVIAVGTDLGLTFINGPLGEGTSVHVTHSTASIVPAVILHEDGAFTYAADTSTNGRFLHTDLEIPMSDVVKNVSYRGNESHSFYHSVLTSNYTEQKFKIAPGNGNQLVDDAVANTAGVTFLKHNTRDPNNTLLAWAAWDFNTSWMKKNCSSANLCSVEKTPITETESVSSLADAYTYGSASLDLTGGVLTSTLTDDGGNNGWEISVPTVIGETYVVTMEGGERNNTANYTFTVPGFSLNVNGDDVYVSSFKATGQLAKIRLTSNGSGAIGDTIQTLSLSVRIADPDRSINHPTKAAVVHGTVQRVEMAPNAEMAWFTGWSGINFIEQPHTPALDFGTGDFAYYGMFKHASTAGGMVFSRNSPDMGAAGVSLYFTAGELAFRMGGSAGLTDRKRYDDGRAHFFVLQRIDGMAQLWVDGVLIYSDARGGTVTNTNATLRFGLDQNGARASSDLKIAQIKYGVDTFTKEEIKFMSKDYLRMARTNAQATIYSGSSTVKGFAKDPETGIIHAGTAGGVSHFDGPIRVGHTTNTIGRFIEVHDGTVLEQ